MLKQRAARKTVNSPGEKGHGGIVVPALLYSTLVTCCPRVFHAM